MKTVIITQARMSSTRLPGKIMRKVLGKSLLEYHIERLQQVKEVEEAVVATTNNSVDDTIVDMCEHLRVSSFRGSEEDVLSRYHAAASEYHADTVVRVTSDCPLIDPAVVDQVIRAYKSRKSGEVYASNNLRRTYPRGMDCEVFSFEVLAEAAREATEPSDREHVTPFIYRQPERYGLINVTYDRDCSNHRWTVDTPEDFELIKRILENLYPDKPAFTLEDILRLMEDNPDWLELNRHIVQKAIKE
jgi:spore coat polysaccharide biosynthesis protein SpsF